MTRVPNSSLHVPGSMVFQTENKVATINTMPAEGFLIIHYLLPIKLLNQAQARATVPLENRMMYKFIYLQNTDTHGYAYLA
jgi:hypothetical protein